MTTAMNMAVSILRNRMRCGVGALGIALGAAQHARHKIAQAGFLRAFCAGKAVSLGDVFGTGLLEDAEIALEILIAEHVDRAMPVARGLTRQIALNASPRLFTER